MRKDQDGNWYNPHVGKQGPSGWAVAAFVIALLLGTLFVADADARPAPKQQAAPVTVAVVGDIACQPPFTVTATRCRHQQVADLITDQNPDALIVPGDIQYNSGTLAHFNQSYDPAFGALLPITYPAPGNHEYLTTNASGYATYFNDSQPYWYSFDLGTWHIISLDSNCSKIGGCGGSKAQALWLKADLKANRDTACTLAFWHHPRFNSGEHGGAKNMTWAWNKLDYWGAEVILNGHEHSYQRFQEMTKKGVATNNGLTEFVVGTGGKSHYTGGSTSPKSEYRNTTDYGALFADLSPSSFDYQFVTEGGSVLDTGSVDCHGR